MGTMKIPAGLLFTIAAAHLVLAQPSEGAGGFMRFNPLFQALDTDEDGVLSAVEIRNAAKSLRKLDKNKDSQLTADEVRPNFPQRGGPGGPDGERRRPERPEGGESGGAADPEEIVRNLMAFDKNGDGKLSRDELPERMQGMLERGHTNKDGFLTPDEIRTMVRTQQSPGGDTGREQGRGGPGGERRIDPMFAALDLNHDGVLSKEEIDAAPASLKALDKNGDGTLTMDELRPAGFGPPHDHERQQ
jgi:Ca2+-binding EF-hand superfamily protein